MKKAISFLLAFAATVFLLVMFTHILPGQAAPEAQTAAIWLDDFDSPVLNERWTWIRENPAKWSLTEDPGSLRLITSGSLFGEANTMENILLTPVGVGDFRITTKATISPTENFLAADVFIYQDDDHYLKLSRLYADGQQIRFRKDEDDVLSTHLVDVSDETVYLQIIKDGDTYHAFYGSDGLTWLPVGSLSFTGSSLKIGLGASQGPATTAVPAAFDFFKYEPVVAEDIWSDSFPGPSLQPGWTWLYEDPSHWSLTENPGRLTIQAQPGGLRADANNMHNLLLASPPYGDFSILTRVAITPTENYQLAALYVYQDDDNYIRLSRGYANGDAVGWRREVNGVPSTEYFTESSNQVLLRIDRIGSTYYGFWSSDTGPSDQADWQSTGGMTVDLLNPWVGLGSETGPSLTELPTEYIFFAVLSDRFETYIPLANR